MCLVNLDIIWSLKFFLQAFYHVSENGEGVQI